MQELYLGDMYLGSEVEDRVDPSETWDKKFLPTCVPVLKSNHDDSQLVFTALRGFQNIYIDVYCEYFRRWDRVKHWQEKKTSETI